MNWHDGTVTWARLASKQASNQHSRQRTPLIPRQAQNQCTLPRTFAQLSIRVQNSARENSNFPPNAIMRITRIPRLSKSTSRTFANRADFLSAVRNRSAAVPFRTKFLVSSSLALGTFLAVDTESRNAVTHWAKIAKRSSVVGLATVQCVWNYKRVLSQEYSNAEEKQAALSECHKKCANITYHALSKNGGIYIKLGQHLTAMTYLLPPEWPEAMIPLQDQCPESSVAEIDDLFFTDFHKHLNEIFVKFDPNPIGVASLAQVHLGKLRETGEEVAVKIQHPRLKEFVPLDLMLTQTVFKALTKVFPEYDLNWLGDELQKGIYIELDFRIEAQNSKNTTEYFAPKKYQRATALRVPQVKWASQRVLLMEYVPGHRLDDLEYLDAHKIDRAEVCSCLAHIFNNMIFTPGVGIHCDPHGGNLAIRHLPDSSRGGHNFEIVLYDHGQYRNISTPRRVAYARMWLGLIDGNPEVVKENAQRFAEVSDEHFELFAAAITGRDYEHALGDLRSERTQEEIYGMTSKLTNEGLLTKLMEMLAGVPRIVLLVLKTNDLVRNLDERLQNPMGNEHNFLVMAYYCAKTVLEDDLSHVGGSFWSVIVGTVKAYWHYESRVWQLWTYDSLVSLKHKFG